MGAVVGVRHDVLVLCESIDIVFGGRLASSVARRYRCDFVPIWYSCTGNSLPCPAGMPPAIEERCKAEIVRLHDAFVAWFTGSCDSSGDTYERTIGSVLSPSFSMVGPMGGVIPANLLHERLQAAYGSHSEHGIAIEIKNVEVVSSSGSQYLVRAPHVEQDTEETEGGTCSS